MLTKKQFEIFETFTQNIFKDYTLKQLKEKTNSNNNLNIAIKEFKKNNLIREKKIGKNSLYSLNLQNPQIFPIIEILNLNSIENKKIINKITNILENNNIHFYALVIFGSHAINKQNKNSDMDIALFVQKKLKIHEQLIEEIKLKSIIEIDIHIIEFEEFLTMINNKEENLGKEILKKNKPIINSRIFYKIINNNLRDEFNN